MRRSGRIQNPASRDVSKNERHDASLNRSMNPSKSWTAQSVRCSVAWVERNGLGRGISVRPALFTRYVRNAVEAGDVPGNLLALKERVAWYPDHPDTVKRKPCPTSRVKAGKLCCGECRCSWQAPRLSAGVECHDVLQKRRMMPKSSRRDSGICMCDGPLPWVAQQKTTLELARLQHFGPRLP